MNEMRPPRAKARKHDISAIASRYDRVALVLQGGGALGAYQIGIHQALAEAGCEPNWISGVSIGAINSAIIAGNGTEKRLQNLEAFWSTISGRKIWAYTPEGDIFRDFRKQSDKLADDATFWPTRVFSISTKITKATRGTTSFRAPRCASIGTRAMKILCARFAIPNGWSARRYRAA